MSFPASYAVGVRMPYARVPRAVQAWIADRLGEPVLEVDDVIGGMAPGAAAVIRGVRGRGMFVKAVGSFTNEACVDLYRREAATGFGLPDIAGVVKPVATHDLVVDGEDWVVTVFPALAGKPPRHPWRSAELEQVLDAWVPIGTTLTPCPYPDVTSAGLVGFFHGWEQIAQDPDDTWHPVATSWVDREECFRAAVAEGGTFCHSDLRADNILLGAGGETYFVDWAHGHRGPQWIDPALLCGDVVASGADLASGGEIDLSPTSAVWRHAAFAGAEVALLMTGVSAYGATMHRFSVKPPNPALPTIRGWQHLQAEAIAGFLRHHPC
ncbi:MAG: phosphotransferase [Propionibacteriaceae bacterium]